MEENDLSSNTINPKTVLQQGCWNANIPDRTEFINSSKTLEEYFKEQITKHFNGADFNIIEEREEFEPTNYIKNPRPLKVFVVEDFSKEKYVFAFDVANCNV